MKVKKHTRKRKNGVTVVKQHLRKKRDPLAKYIIPDHKLSETSKKHLAILNKPLTKSETRKVASMKKRYDKIHTKIKAGAAIRNAKSKHRKK